MCDNISEFIGEQRTFKKLKFYKNIIEHNADNNCIGIKNCVCIYIYIVIYIYYI